MTEFRAESERLVNERDQLGDRDAGQLAGRHRAQDDPVPFAGQGPGWFGYIVVGIILALYAAASVVIFVHGVSRGIH